MKADGIRREPSPNCLQKEERRLKQPAWLLLRHDNSTDTDSPCSFALALGVEKGTFVGFATSITAQ
jgi:hypothetical protein